MNKKTYIEKRELKDVMIVFWIEVERFKWKCDCQEDYNCLHWVPGNSLDMRFNIDFYSDKINLGKAYERYEQYLNYMAIPKEHTRLNMESCIFRHPILLQRPELELLKEFEDEVMSACVMLESRRRDNEAKRTAYEDMDDFMKTVEKVARENCTVSRVDK